MNVFWDLESDISPAIFIINFKLFLTSCRYFTAIVGFTNNHLTFFQVKAVVLDPSNGFNVDRTLTKDDVEKLIKV